MIENRTRNRHGTVIAEQPNPAVAGRLYEAARRAGTLRHDARPWSSVEPETKDRWLRLADAVAPEVRLDVNAIVLLQLVYQAALDQPNPSKLLQRAIAEYDLHTSQRGKA